MAVPRKPWQVYCWTGRSSDSRISLLAAPSRLFGSGSTITGIIKSGLLLAAFVPGYSGGTVTVSHRLPF